MKVFLLALLLCTCGAGGFAQNSIGSTRAGVSYAHDFPGLNGYSIHGEFLKPFNDKIEFGMGLRYSSMIGNPRTPNAEEYTKSTNLDFHLYFLPVNTEQHAIRIGAGYSFAFYAMQRAYPQFLHNSEGTASWITTSDKGKNKWFSIVSEYEYKIPNTNLSTGIRGSFFKAYDGISTLGIFGAMQL